MFSNLFKVHRIAPQFPSNVVPFIFLGIYVHGSRIWKILSTWIAKVPMNKVFKGLGGIDSNCKLIAKKLEKKNQDQ